MDAPLPPCMDNPMDGLALGQVGFGAAEIGNLYRAVSERESLDVLEAAHAAGIRFFDTAPSYGAGLSELRLGAFLRSLPRRSYVLSTKAGRIMERPDGTPFSSPFHAPLPFRAVFDYSYDGVMRSFEHSTRRLGITNFDLFLLHDLDRKNHGEALDQQIAIARDGAFVAMEELKRNNDVTATGFAINEADTATRLLDEVDCDVALLAGRYTLLEASALETFFPRARQRNVRVLMAGVYNTGILASGVAAGAKYNYVDAHGPIVQRVARIEAICARFGVSLAAVALRYVLRHPQVTSAIIGSTRPERFPELSRTLALEIDDALWAALAEAGVALPEGLAAA